MDSLCRAEIISSLCRLSFFLVDSQIDKYSLTEVFSDSSMTGSQFTWPSKVQNSSSLLIFFSLELFFLTSRKSLVSVSFRKERR